MKTINNNNRYYCHRRMRTGKLVAKKKKQSTYQHRSMIKLINMLIVLEVCTDMQFN